jgi:hypothetical protein
LVALLVLWAFFSFISQASSTVSSAAKGLATGINEKVVKPAEEIVAAVPNAVNSTLKTHIKPHVDNVKKENPALSQLWDNNLNPLSDLDDVLSGTATSGQAIGAFLGTSGVVGGGIIGGALGGIAKMVAVPTVDTLVAANPFRSDNLEGFINGSGDQWYKNVENTFAKIGSSWTQSAETITKLDTIIPAAAEEAKKIAEDALIGLDDLTDNIFGGPQKEALNDILAMNFNKDQAYSEAKHMQQTVGRQSAVTKAEGSQMLDNQKTQMAASGVMAGGTLSRRIDLSAQNLNESIDYQNSDAKFMADAIRAQANEDFRYLSEQNIAIEERNKQAKIKHQWDKVSTIVDGGLQIGSKIAMLAAGGI